ncbi:hypothetical protein [Halolamina salina]|uniref:Uncharacterized protein n=1 Tax=Halolamina salina TaxID=1220023 RepID=A0ABD6B8C0_9EURY
MTSSSEDGEEELDSLSERQFERLQNSLKEYGEDDIIEREKIGDNLDEIEKEELYKLSDGDASELISFYITTSALIEQESILIINAYVFDFGSNGRGSIEFLEQNLNQHDREAMLYHLGLIDSGLKGELSRVRRKRNDLAHSSDHGIIEDISRLQNDIKRAKEAKDQLKEIGREVELELLIDDPEKNS